MPKVKNNKKPDVVGRVERDEQNGRQMPVVIFDKWCKGCGICIEFCPKGVLKFDAAKGKAHVANPEDCIRCGQCELRCPDFAITRLAREDDDGEKKD